MDLAAYKSLVTFIKVVLLYCGGEILFGVDSRENGRKRIGGSKCRHLSRNLLLREEENGLQQSPCQSKERERELSVPSATTLSLFPQS